MNREESLLAILLDERNNDTANKYTLIINKNAPNKELMLLKENSLEGAKKYYPDKEFEVLVEKINLKVVLEKIFELELTDYDVVFLDNLVFEDFYITERYLLTKTGVRSIVIDSRSRNQKNSSLKKIEDKIKEELDNAKDIYNLTPFDELLLGSKIDSIKKYAEEKGISLNLK